MTCDISTCPVVNRAIEESAYWDVNRDIYRDGDSISISRPNGWLDDLPRLGGFPARAPLPPRPRCSPWPPWATASPQDACVHELLRDPADRRAVGPAIRSQDRRDRPAI